jgi:hypothetical protein
MALAASPEIVMVELLSVTMLPVNGPDPLSKIPNWPVEVGGEPVPGMSIVPALVKEPAFPPIRFTPIAPTPTELDIVPLFVTELLELRVTAAPAALTETEPPLVMSMFPGVPFAAVAVVTGAPALPLIVRLSASTGAATMTPIAPDKSTLRFTTPNSPVNAGRMTGQRRISMLRQKPADALRPDIPIPQPRMNADPHFRF